eukprot:TRINITY_DN21767_c0_g1_i2.p3 TRINITY_DN21767_c0_g1~~TRINITY_DN21767_c0_g1_i2.p3  ORF type:complete len:109 (+),score=7.93 TRINITY_DN21767_c0_g1_i2:152-478(+)
MPEAENASSQELKIVGKCVDQIITPSLTYQHSKVAQWVQEVVDSSMQALMQLQMPRKYIVHCTILQKSGAGLHSNTACYWDAAHDGHFTHRAENKSMIVVTNVFGVAV